MDLTISNRVWADSSLSTSEKMVLLALDHLGEIDPDGFSWYGYEKLADITGINLESKYLTKLINKLQEKGYILIWRQHGRKGGRGYTHIYWPIIGRTDDQILETIMRRFIATEEEARAIIGQSGPIYDDLIKRNRVSGKTLEDTKAIKKGVLKTPIDNKGYTDYTQSNDIGVPETPINEDDTKKGVLGTPRLLDSSNPESKPIQESPKERGGQPPSIREVEQKLEQVEPEVEKPPPRTEYTPFMREFLTAFSAKRFKNDTQAKTIASLTARFGEPKLRDLIEWAANKGMGLGDAVASINSALTKPKPTKNGASHYGYNKSTKRTNPPAIPPEADPGLYTRMQQAAIRAAADDSD